MEGQSVNRHNAIGRAKKLGHPRDKSAILLMELPQTAWVPGLGIDLSHDPADFPIFCSNPRASEDWLALQFVH